MLVVWDEAKAIGNLKKHGLDFKEAMTCFDDFRAIIYEDKRHAEQRFVTLGLSARLNLCVVVSCYVGPDQLRIISARKAMPKERLQYEKRI